MLGRRVRVQGWRCGASCLRVNLVGMPRKNGKSAVASVLTLTNLMLGGRGSEIYSVAAEKEQARIG